MLDINRPRSVWQTRSSSEEKRIESGSSACPLSELPLSRGTHGNTHLLPLDNALLFPTMDQFGSCLTYRPLNNQYDKARHRSFKSGKRKTEVWAWNERSTGVMKSFNPCPMDSVPESFLPQGRCLIAGPPLPRENSRRSAPARGWK